MSRGISFENTFAKIGHAVCRRERTSKTKGGPGADDTCLEIQVGASIPFGLIWERCFCHVKLATHTYQILAGKVRLSESMMSAMTLLA
jgi:hypothetical protein